MAEAFHFATGAHRISDFGDSPQEVETHVKRLADAGFDLIVPCGLHGRTVTSMARLLGERCPPLAQVREQLAGRLQDGLSCR